MDFGATFKKKKMNEQLHQLMEANQDRYSFCIELVNTFKLSSLAEVGVFKGDFAQRVLAGCAGVETYTMIDPWRNLSAWNKPANKDDDTFELFFQEAMDKTDFAQEKRIVLRGRTTEVIHEIADDTFDFVYIDGDHTLKGITIDLINLWPKLKEGAYLVGDDFLPSIWQHGQKFEPTMVFPFAVYFAEAVNAQIYALPYEQFLIQKKANSHFEFIDWSNGKYDDLALRTQFFKLKG